MLCSYWIGNLIEFEEGLVDNTKVLSKSLTKKSSKLSANNQLRLLLYSTYLSTNATCLLRGEVTVVNEKATEQKPDSPSAESTAICISYLN